MRFTTRTFLWSFLPFTVLLVANFWAVRTAVMSAVRDGLRTSVRQHQALLAGEHVRSARENGRLLKIVVENPALKAGIQLLITETGAREAARRTVEDQLSEIGTSLEFDFLVVSNPDGVPLAGIARRPNGFAAADLKTLRLPQSGYLAANAMVYQLTSAAIPQGAETIGMLTVGESFDLAKLATPAVLTHEGQVIASNIEGLALGEIESSLKKCPAMEECELGLKGDSYLSVPLAGGSSPYVLRSLQSVDAASAPVQASLRNVFVTGIVTAIFAALGIGWFSSRSIGRPLGAVVAHLRESGRTGTLPEFPQQRGSVQEIRELTAGFNQAALAIRQAREDLTRAYVEFVGSLANALDARDPYTAGHSRRVSAYAVAIAQKMKLAPEELDTIRVGALLHDIGKIGISDLILLKPGRLTETENALIQEHPVIGRRILEGVHGLEPYLPVVELHHENWDGSGYPRGLAAEETPLPARIVKVADAYDAMTSSRPYRAGMSHERALHILEKATGTEMDRSVVAAFAALERVPEIKTEANIPQIDGLRNLSSALDPSPHYAVDTKVETKSI